jgi:hypothetical protein
MEMDFYDRLKQVAFDKLKTRGLLRETVRVKARALSAEEAIGHPESDDFPIQKGKERLMQAQIRGAAGQAFTDRFGDYEGTLEQILQSPLSNNYRRAIFVAALNAALRSVGLISGTIHCRDKEPDTCAQKLCAHLKETYGRVRITQVGFQPRMIEKLSGAFEMRVLDMDLDNIGKEKFGVMINGPEETEAAVHWADLLLVTGTTLVNGTLPRFLTTKKTLFYGTTIAGAAHLMGLARFCDQGH